VLFRRIRQLRVSLAVKCQLLFGAAAVLIIAAALFVPWTRMQQLTGQLNEKAAAALTANAVAEHVERETARLESGAVPPQRAPVLIDGQPYAPPHLSGVWLAPVANDRMNRFERNAISRFLEDPNKSNHDTDYQLKDGSWGYRYAQPMYMRAECQKCHEPDTNPALLAAASIPGLDLRPIVAATQPTDRPPKLIGIASVEIPSQIASGTLLLNHVFLLLAGLIAGVLAIVTLYFIITRLILSPVRVLQETAEKVSAGDLNIRSDINSGDEFQQLSETLNTMLRNLKQSADQLRAVNKSLDARLGQLAESNVALYESNRLKSEFLANVSHELRTPLNSILGFAELLKDATVHDGDAPKGDAPKGDASKGDASKSLRYLQNILSSSNHLLALINDLLDLAKIEAGRMEVRSEPLSLPDLFEGLSSLLKPLIEQKQLVLDSTVAPEVPILHTDPAKLQQVLYNFLSNAIKFSPKAGTINLTAEREFRDDGSAAVRISVRDRGPGIESDKQDLIFEKFRQIDGSVTRQHGGSGLGLAISKELVTLIGGTIGVTSTPGHGATFWIVLPLKIESGAQDVRSKMVLTT
jgi:signal transduction histidine kinase